MNGWQRLGIVLSTLWFLSVIGYAAYERSLLPIKVFSEETEDPGAGWYVAQSLSFIQLDYRSAGDASGPMQRYSQAKTDQERKAAMADLANASRRVFETSIKDVFWLWLVAPVVALWVLTYLAMFISKWVISGFAGIRK